MEPAAQNLASDTKTGKKPFWFLFVLCVLVVTAVAVWLQRSSARPLPATAQTETPATELAVPTSTQKDSFYFLADKYLGRVPLPDEVRGIYLTAYTAGSSRFDELLAYAVKSHLNAFVIDVKLDNGSLAFAPNDPNISKYATEDLPLADLDGLLAKLKGKNIYRIARIFVMRDGAFGKLNPEVSLKDTKGMVWRDKTGTPWLDPAAPQVADYAVELAREVYARGFDEVQFDYVRYPTDGNVSQIVYPYYDEKTPKALVMKKFFDTVSGELRKDGIPVSYDFYGMTCWRTDDFGIGQRLAGVHDAAVAISPMVYPSHYPDGFEGFANPSEHPYDIVKLSLDKGMDILKIDFPQLDATAARRKMRPWIQDFDLGAEYDAPKIQAQIRAARDAGAGGWLIWNARNVYTPTDYAAEH